MKRFAQLYEELDSTTSTNAKVTAMIGYFRLAPPDDAAWALFFLTGQRLKRLLSGRLLADWAMEMRGIPSWLFSDCYEAVGDLAESVALLLAGRLETEPGAELSLGQWMETRILPLVEVDAEEQKTRVTSWWRELGARELFMLNKVLTGELRVGVSHTLVTRAVANVAGVDPAVMAHKLMGTWRPTAEFFTWLTSGDTAHADASRPYPFCLATQLDQDVRELGNRADYQAEWKWDGIRAQILRRDELHIWSRGEELITDRFPELHEPAMRLPPGTVLDGEIVASLGGPPLPFQVLQQRIGRKKLTPQILASAPAAFLAYDILEEGGTDLRGLPLRERRVRLEALVRPVGPPFSLSEVITAPDWDALTALRRESRERSAEGLMLKHLGSPYGTGRRRGDWWKWKIDPYTVDAVLIYAQPGSGRRSNLFTDYTFGVWHEGKLVPVAKAYSGLSDAEIAEMDRWIRGHTVERHGPVRAVEPVHVFELAFEAIAESSRHRSGIALRFPRMARWRRDKPASEADTLERVRALLKAHQG
ncbi:MAG: ATP-dependent DNA ligase [Myxococcota bacterium]